MLFGLDPNNLGRLFRRNVSLRLRKDLVPGLKCVKMGKIARYLVFGNSS